MSRKVIKVTRSDGSSEEIVETKQGFLHWLGVVFAVMFVLVMAVHTWWLGMAILLLLVVALVGRRANESH